MPLKPAELGSIEGWVYESDGKTPVSGVSVWVYDEHGHLTSLGRTNIRGKYTIKELLPGFYILKIHSGEHYGTGTGSKYAGEYYKNAYW